MPYKTGANSQLGVVGFNLTDVDTVAKVPVGTIVKAFDDVQGDGEFIYLPGVASTAQGDAVVYDLAPGAQSVSRLAANAQNNTGRPVAFAVTALGAGQFGWFQISGVAIVSAVAGTVAGVVMASATTGSVSNTADAGDQIIGARISTAVGTPLANKCYATLNRPCMQSQIT